MIVDYCKGSKWLPYVMDRNNIHKLSDIDKQQLLNDADKTCCGYCISYFTKNNKDIVLYAPFFETIQCDIWEFYKLTYYGNLHLYCEWPYNEDIENSLMQIITNMKKNHYRYNKHTDVIFEKSDEFSYLGEQMNQDDYYEQAYQDEYSVRLYHFAYHGKCQSFGGVCLFIEKGTNNISIFGVGEDDGNMFPETVNYHDYEISGINRFELWRLCSMVNDINVPEIDGQIVIEKLYNQLQNGK